MWATLASQDCQPDSRSKGAWINALTLDFFFPSLRSTGCLPIWAEPCRQLLSEQGCLEVTSKQLSMSGQTTRVCLNMSDIFKVSAGLLAKEKKITDIQDRKQGWGGNK